MRILSQSCQILNGMVDGFLKKLYLEVKTKAKHDVMKKILLYLLLLFSGVAGAQAIVVPDADFLAQLLAADETNDIAKDSDGNAIAIDADGDNTITEAEAAEVRELNVSGAEIASMAGIEYFTDLRVLNCANNNVSALNLLALEDLRVLNCSTNLLAELNVASLEYLITLDCHDNNLTTLDLNSNTELTSLACYGNELVTLFVKNGKNETFDPANWSGNLTLEYICADESQVALIQANESLPETTQVNSYCSYEPGGIYNRISGVVKYDGNNNGSCSDGDDYVIPSFRLKISAGGYEDDIFTKADGTYVFYVAAAGEYNVAPVFENEYFIADPAIATTNFVVVNGAVETKNFCIRKTAAGHLDVEVVIAPVTNAQPGFNAIYKMVYKNKGNQTIPSGDVTCYWDSSRLNYVDMYPMANNIGIDTYTWNYTNLKPFECREIIMELNVNDPTDTPPVNVDDVLTFGMTINPAEDDFPQDNTFEFNQVAVGSMESNNIACIEGDTVNPDAIGEYLHYVVNFENTGTAPADFVVIQMDIDPAQFDINSLRLMNSSHTVTSRVINNRVEFRFDQTLGVADHGNILFKQKTKNSLMSGSMVATMANIYFDYNFPIGTNNANTTFALLSTGEFEIDNSVKVYPNPAKDIVKVDTDNIIKSIQLYDIQGRLLQTGIINEISASFDMSNRAAGIYFLKITTDKGIKVEKLVKE